MEAAVAMIPAVIGGAAKVAGGISERKSAYRAAAVDDENARRTLFQGELDAGDIARAERMAAGQAVVDMAGSGMMLGEGTARDILEQSLMQREMDIQRTRLAHMFEADGLKQEARAKRRAGKAAARGAVWSAVSGVVKAGSASSNAARRSTQEASERAAQQGPLPYGMRRGG